LEQQTPDLPPLQVSLSDQATLPATSTQKQSPVLKDKVNSKKPSNAEGMMQMNGLKFRKGLGVVDASDITYRLQGNWQTFRADVGIDDACRDNGGLQFQVYGDGRLLFDSGLIVAPAVVKPELDIRGIEVLRLTTTGVKKKASAAVCANWANATVIGFRGDKVGQ